MNPKYMDSPIFTRRKEEWNKPKVKEYIDHIFQTIECLPGWTFAGSEWIEVERPKRKEDLKKSIFSVLQTKILSPEGREFLYSVQTPDLYHDQFFFIGGFLRVPIFQLFDLPIIYRSVPGHSGGETILKLRTNAISVTADLDRRDGVPMINVFNRDIPFGYLLAAMHTREELIAFRDAHPGENAVLEQICETAEEEWQKNRTTEQVHEFVGEFFMNQPAEKLKKGEGTLFSLKVAYEVDAFSKKYFHTNSIIFELMHAIWEGPRSDTDIQYKRIRFAEYVLSPLIHKVYEMIITLNKHKREKFQIPQNILMEHCNSSDGKDNKVAVSNIIHYNNPINPVGEISSFLQCSLVGPGGFKKDNVPPHLRNMDESQFGILCAADTPDREGCGVIQNMVPTVKIDELGMFGETDDEVVTSFPISLVPFMEHDDPTRLQMASNQIKQTIMLKSSELPWVRSGNEGLYLDETTFQYRAKEDGIVVHIDPSFMVVVYDRVTPKQVDIFQIRYRSLYLNTIDYIEPKYSIGDRFIKDSVLCQSKFIKDDQLSLGQNLLTAIMIWKGFNYEDGIVISESVVEKMSSLHAVDLSYVVESGQVLLSLVNDQYVPIPKIGQKLSKGETFAKIKNLDWENGFDNINEEPIEQKSPLDCTIISSEIFPNMWNHQVDEFNNKIKNFISNQLIRYNLIVNSLGPYMSKDDINKFMLVNGLTSLNCEQKRIGNFYNKGQKIGGVLFKMRGLYEENIGAGDKVANRHGNKGVIARVVPDNEMPSLPDGRRVEIVINPLGIISRMNVGQLFELHMGEAIYQLRQSLYSMEVSEARSRLSDFLSLVDNTDNGWTTEKILSKFDKDVSEKGLKVAVDNIYVIMTPFRSASYDQIKQIMEFTGATYTQQITDNDVEVDSTSIIRLLDPSYAEHFSAGDFTNQIACGYMYFHKLVHRASEKVAARSIGPYNKKTSQPMGGKSNQGGHRLGEMEVWALLAHDAKDFLKDLLTVHSDSVGLKNKVLSEILQNPSLIEEEEQDDRPQSLRIMEAYLNIAGLTMNTDDGRLPDLLNQEAFEVKDLDERPGLNATIGELSNSGEDND